MTFFTPWKKKKLPPKRRTRLKRRARKLLPLSILCIIEERRESIKLGKKKKSILTMANVMREAPRKDRKGHLLNRIPGKSQLSFDLRKRLHKPICARPPLLYLYAQHGGDNSPPLKSYIISLQRPLSGASLLCIQ